MDRSIAPGPSANNPLPTRGFSCPATPLSIAYGVRLADLLHEVVTTNSARLSTSNERQSLTESRRSEIIFDAEVTMRRMTLSFVAAVMIAAGIGTWATLRYHAAKPDLVATGSVGSPSIARMAPLEIMKERGEDLPAAKNVDPF
jgi:hypothetical protein